jgi:histidinol phosphatase-like PHP family hydrolase
MDRRALFDWPVKIDLHVHASERSGCSTAGEEELIEAAIDYGLDGLAFTDHHRLVDPGRLEQLNRRYAPFLIFGGVEISLIEGEDVLVLGVRDPALEERDWDYPTLFDLVRSQGGFVTLAHPFRYSGRIAIDIERYRPDAIEALSVHIGLDQADLISLVRARLDLPALFNSDAHRVDHVGLYCNALERAVRTEEELIEELAAGRYAPQVCRDRVLALNRCSGEHRRLPLRDLAEERV